MNSKLFNTAALFEHRFFLQILGDHARFIFNSLSPNEKKEIQQANYYIKTFDKLLEKANGAESEEEIMALTSEAIRFSQQFRAFKLEIIARKLIDKIAISLTPTFINHMVNELEEYLKILTVLINMKIPQTHEIHHHLLWLPDASGHASFIQASLDMTEKDLILESENFSQEFEDHYITAIEMRGYMRTGIKHFPTLKFFNEKIEDRISLFSEFLKKLYSNIAANNILGILSPLALDHMIREECYYITKIVESNKEINPSCNSTSPRKET